MCKEGVGAGSKLGARGRVVCEDVSRGGAGGRRSKCRKENSPMVAGKVSREQPSPGGRKGTVGGVGWEKAGRGLQFQG